LKSQGRYGHKTGFEECPSFHIANVILNGYVKINEKHYSLKYGKLEDGQRRKSLEFPAFDGMTLDLN